MVQRYASLLSPEEWGRARRFRFERDRRRFTVARGVLRTLLGQYLGIDSRSIEFSYASHGKPFLAGALSAQRLYFNVSHSGELALYAIAREREVGVDIELVHTIDDAQQIAERFFSLAENAALRALPAEVKEEAFFTCWTRKEAYIKALGEGLSLPLHEFDVSLTPGEPARFLGAVDREHALRWTLRELDPAPGYVAALVAEGSGWEVTCWRWEDERA